MPSRKVALQRGLGSWNREWKIPRQMRPSAADTKCVSLAHRQSTVAKSGTSRKLNASRMLSSQRTSIAEDGGVIVEAGAGAFDADFEFAPALALAGGDFLLRLVLRL